MPEIYKEIQPVSRSTDIFHRPLAWLAMLLCLAAMACGQEEPLKVGFMACTTGRAADLGIDGRDGAMLAVELRNQSGGVNGKKVILLSKDSGYEARTARQACRELLEQGVTALIGPMTSDSAVAMVPMVNRARVVMLSPTVTTEKLSGKDDYFFRIVSSTKGFATASANFQLKSKTMRRVAAAVDLDNRSFSELWTENFRKALEKGGGSLVARVNFHAEKSPNYRRITNELLAAKPDGIALVGGTMDSALLCQQIRKLNPNIPITLANWMVQAQLVGLGGRAVEGVTVVQTFDRQSGEPGYVKFAARFRKTYGREPGFGAVYAYDASNFLMKALARKGDRESLKTAVLSLGPFDGLLSRISLDRFGDAVDRPYSMAVLKNGRFRTIR